MKNSILLILLFVLTSNTCHPMDTKDAIGTMQEFLKKEETTYNTDLTRVLHQNLMREILKGIDGKSLYELALTSKTMNNFINDNKTLIEESILKNNTEEITRSRELNNKKERHPFSGSSSESEGASSSESESNDSESGSTNSSENESDKNHSKKKQTEDRWLFPNSEDKSDEDDSSSE